MNGSEIPSTALPGPNGRVGAALLALGPGFCGAPLPAAGQVEAPSKAAALVTGGLLGMTASSLALAGACATRLIADDDLESYECAIYGAAIGVVPALSSRFGLTCRDHASLNGRPRSVAHGALGGLVEAVALTWFQSDRTAPGHQLAADALWGAGVGLVTAALGPTLHDLLFSP